MRPPLSISAQPNRFDTAPKAGDRGQHSCAIGSRDQHHECCARAGTRRLDQGAAGGKSRYSKALHISLSGQFIVIDQHIANAYRREAQHARALARLISESREIVLS